MMSRWKIDRGQSNCSQGACYAVLKEVGDEEYDMQRNLCIGAGGLAEFADLAVNLAGCGVLSIRR